MSVCLSVKMKHNEDISPESAPYDRAVAELSPHTSEAYLNALAITAQTLDLAKRMLLQQRVRSFAAADVVALTRTILEREQAEAARQQGRGM